MKYDPTIMVTYRAGYGKWTFQAQAKRKQSEFDHWYEFMNSQYSIFRIVSSFKIA